MHQASTNMLDTPCTHNNGGAQLAVSAPFFATYALKSADHVATLAERLAWSLAGDVLQPHLGGVVA